jgi:hypothetical protein
MPDSRDSYGSLPDRDGDGVPDGFDICERDPNPFDVDTNADGTPDAQRDNDNDGMGNVCDRNDDNDSKDDRKDNCPTVFNSEQEDMDDDGYDASDPNTGGDVCDQDRDGDGYTNYEELTVYLTDPSNPDSDGDNTCDGPDRPAAGGCNAGPDLTPLGDNYSIIIQMRSGTTDVTESWLPEVLNSVDVVAKLRDPHLNYVPFQDDVTFTLIPGAKPGRALNESETGQNDASFSPSGPLNTKVVDASGSTAAVVTLHSFDFGTLATVSVNTQVGSSVSGSTRVPTDRDNDEVPDAIEVMYASCGFDPYNPYSFQSGILDGNTDLDQSLNNTFSGDGIFSKDEWRGVTRDANVDDSNVELLTRLNPCRKTLFVRGDNFSNSLPPSTVPNVLAFSLSVDDVIAPGSNGVNALDEINLQVIDVTGLPTYQGPSEPPSIDILVVTNDTVNTNTIVGSANGYIGHFGTPYIWQWDVNGASCIGDSTVYGSGQTDPPDCGTFIYHLNLMHYFYNRPYMDDTSAIQGQTTYTEYLENPDLIEDNIIEDGLLSAGEDSFYNGTLDGDHKVGGWDDTTNPVIWDQTDPQDYKAGYDLSVFDKDGDGLVENPPIDDPQETLHSDPDEPDPGEYTPQQKVTHTQLHEIFHSLGVYEHSTEDWCLLYWPDYNWSRAGHVSTFVREQVQVHNGD